MDKGAFICGHKTMLDGTRVPIGEEEARAIWHSAEARAAARREAMPDSLAALYALHDARERLREEGWRNGVYCPKDGTEFAVIEYGSTGIFSGFYLGDWPDGHVMVCDGLSAPQAILWKPIDALSEDERNRMDRCMADHAVMTDAMLRRFSGDEVEFPPPCCTAWEDCRHDGVCHDPQACGAVGPMQAQEGEG